MAQAFKFDNRLAYILDACIMSDIPYWTIQSNPQNFFITDRVLVELKYGIEPYKEKQNGFSEIIDLHDAYTSIPIEFWESEDAQQLWGSVDNSICDDIYQDLFRGLSFLVQQQGNVHINISSQHSLDSIKRLADKYESILGQLGIWCDTDSLLLENTLKFTDINRDHLGPYEVNVRSFKELKTEIEIAHPNTFDPSYEEVVLDVYELSGDNLRMFNLLENTRYFLQSPLVIPIGKIQKKYKDAIEVPAEDRFEPINGIRYDTAAHNEKIYLQNFNDLSKGDVSCIYAGFETNFRDILLSQRDVSIDPDLSTILPGQRGVRIVTADNKL